MTTSDHSYESPKDRASLVREAGLGRLSFPSILAGVLVAYGAFAVLAALVGTVAAAIGLNTDLNRNDWATLGLGSAVAVAVVLLVAYLFGGYVAGRMARRAGLLNGLAVFLLAVALVAVAERSQPARPTPRRSAATFAASASPPPAPNGARPAPLPGSGRWPPCWSARCWAVCSASAGTAS